MKSSIPYADKVLIHTFTLPKHLLLFTKWFIVDAPVNSN